MSEEKEGEKEEWRWEKGGLSFKINFFYLFHIVSIDFSTKFIKQVFI
jgi:hypothetical protein